MALPDPNPAGPIVTSDPQRIVVGALGGLAAVLVKYISQDHASVVQFFSTDLPRSAVFSIVGGYIVLTPILMILGGIIGWVAAETNRMKLFALGISAPALVTTWSSGGTIKVSDILDNLAPSTAVAQGGIAEGIGSFFGNVDRTYLIYVGSFSNRENSDRIVNKINNEVSSLYTIQREFTDAGGRLWHRVYVVQRFSLREALDIRERLLRSKVVDEAKLVQKFDRAP